MKLGVIARTESRGLGNLTWEVAQHMHPDAVLVVVPNHPIPQRLDRYPGATVVRWNHHGDSALDEPTVREFLEELGSGGVLYTAETFYDWDVCDWAREQGVRTVCHVMPEFYRHGVPKPPPGPDVWWAPTRWRLDHLPPGTRIVPVPIATERFGVISETYVSRGTSERLRWLHPAGTRAAADRNGTKIVLSALAKLTAEHVVRIRTQEPRLHRPPHPANVKLETITKPVGEYWEAYDDTDLLILPRRYGGLSLPALEAMGAGVGVVMSDAEPQRSEWPIWPVRAVDDGTVLTPAGRIPLARCSSSEVASAMDLLAEAPETVADLQRGAREFAEEQSWARLEPLYRAELERVAR